MCKRQQGKKVVENTYSYGQLKDDIINGSITKIEDTKDSAGNPAVLITSEVIKKAVHLQPGQML